MMMMISLVLLLVVTTATAAANKCHLPSQWSGNWYLSKDIDLMNINQTNFINRGLCIEHKEDKYVFYDSKESCYRCVFIMQKHYNVLQYRASYCTEQSDFYSNCQNLSPESELVTIYRDDALAENCPLSGLYTNNAASAISNSAQIAFLNLQQQQQDSTNEKCMTNTNENSFLLECADPTSIKFQFNKCSTVPTFDVSCVAHWTEGNTNYLIGRTTLPNQRRGYKCLVYTETNQAADTAAAAADATLGGRSLRYKYDETEDFIELSQSNVNTNTNGGGGGDTIQISISQDEFCRNIDNIIDDQFTFSFTKVSIPKYFNPLLSSQRGRRQLRKNNNNTKNSISLSSVSNTAATTGSTCRFPKWFNKRWNNIKQTKLMTLDHKLDTLVVFDEKRSTIIDKHDCMQIKTRKQNHFQAIVRSLNGCSNSFQCITIINRSEFLTEIRYGKVKYSNGLIECADHFSQMELVYVDTSFGVSCPFRGNLYRKATSLLKAESETEDSEKPCKLMTQTQTLQIGCQNDQQYSLRTKLCYPNQLKAQQQQKQQQHQQNTYTQLESEINLVCMAHWTYDDHLILISRSMSNEILCSVWSMSNDNKILKFYEIDSNCNFYKKTYKLNHEFQLINKCDEKSLAYLSSISVSSSAVVTTAVQKFLLLLLLLQLIS